MKFLLDENIPIKTKETLKDHGFDAKNVFDFGLAGKSDEQLFAKAKKENRILVTLDLDFSNIASYPPKSHPGIIVIRLKTLNRKNIIDNLLTFLKTAKKEDVVQNLIILGDNSYRVRK